MKKILTCLAFFLLLICYLLKIWATQNYKMHDFQDKCLNCHVNKPDKNNPTSTLIFTNNIDTLCSNCHNLNKGKSHPIGTKLKASTPLTTHLDKNNLMTCTTCHDIHKEEKTLNKNELSGLLWGHLQGRSFCLLCHDNDSLNSSWKHQTAIPYAHSYGKLVQNTDGLMLDRYSTECLSCHDGAISKSPNVAIRQGNWQHNGGESHPIGVIYPNTKDFNYSENLPKEIKLFDQKVGCLSCHEIYSKEPDMLSMSNKNSRLCFTCHKK